MKPRSNSATDHARKPNGHWKKWENAKPALEELIKRFGHFPTPAEFDATNNSGLYSAMKLYHGGVTEVRKQLEIFSTRKERGHWENWTNVKNELQQIIEDLGDFPTQKQLIESCKSSLGAALAQYHGGINAARKKLGYEPLTKPMGYWQEWKNVENKMRKIIKKLHRFPMQEDIIAAGEKSLVSAVSKYHGGLEAVAKKLGYEMSVKPKGYWMKWENVEKELDAIRKELGHFPAREELKKLGHTMLGSAISRYHGGSSTVRQRMGEEANFPPAYWKDITNVKKEIDKVMKKTEQFPTGKVLKLLNKSSLISAITKYHGGFGKLRKEYGETPLQKADGYWTLEKTLSTCRSYHQKYNRLPRPKEKGFLEQEFRGMYSGINKHGGIRKIKTLLGLEAETKPNGYWSEERVTSELEQIAATLEHFPTQKELITLGRGDLNAAAQQYGGLLGVRKKLGVELTKMPNGYWTETTIVAQCKNIVGEYGDVLSKDKLLELGKGQLTAQIEKCGGYPYFRKKVGLTLKKRTHRHWTKDKTFDEAEQLFLELGHFPTQNELIPRKMTTLAGAAIEHYGGYHELKKLVLEKHSIVEENPQLKDPLYIVGRLRSIQQEHKLKQLPGSEKLITLGYGDLVSAIKRYHGFNTIRQAAGAKVVAPNGTWSDPNAVITVAKNLMEQNGWTEFPAERQLREVGYSMLPEAIRRCFGDINTFRGKLAEHLGGKDPLEGLLENYLNASSARAEDLLRTYIGDKQ